MMQAQSLRKQFGAVTALREVSFIAPDGRITGLLGANGAGKSTILRILAGLLQPGGGTVQVDGTVGALLDHAGLSARLTTRELLEFSGRLHGLHGSALRARVDTVIEFLGMQTIAERRTAGFSQGERMKTAIGRAMIHNPRNILLDEPANGLDVPSVRMLRQALLRLRAQGVCIVYSSHVLEEVRMLCDRIVIIAGGRVVAEGAAAELCARAGVESLEDAFVALTGEAAAC